MLAEIVEVSIHVKVGSLRYQLFSYIHSQYKQTDILGIAFTSIPMKHLRGVDTRANTFRAEINSLIERIVECWSTYACIAPKILALNVYVVVQIFAGSQKHVERRV